MFAEILKKLRIEKGLTQTEFATQFHVSNGAVGNWESGKRQPDSNTLVKLADFFGVSVDYLLGKTDEPRTLDQQLEGIDFALYGEVHELTDEEKQDIINFARFIKSQRKNND